MEAGGVKAKTYNSLLSIVGMVSFWIRLVVVVMQLFMLIGTALIPLQQVLRDQPRCSHRFEWIRNIVPKEAFESTQGVFPREKKKEFKE